MLSFKSGGWGVLIIAIISFFLGQILPQIWKWKEVRLGEEKQQLEQLKQTIDLRDKVEDKLTKLVVLAGEIRGERNETRKAEIQMKFDLIRDDLVATEKSLSDLEKREPRNIFQTLVPAQPKGLAITLQ